MIKEGKCKICDANIKENGEDKFRDSIERHYLIVHKKLYEDLRSLEENAELDLRDVKNKYPELHFYWGIIQISLKELLK